MISTSRYPLLPPRLTFVVDLVRDTLPFLPVRVVVVFSAFIWPFRPLTVVLEVVLAPPRAFIFVTVRVCTTVEWVRRGAYTRCARTTRCVVTT